VIAGGMAVIVLGLALVIVWRATGPERAREHSTEQRDAAFREEDRVDAASEKKDRMKQMQVAATMSAARAARLKREEGEDPTEWSRRYLEEQGLTDAEIEKLEEDSRKVGEVFWEQAPQVLEEMLAGDERDEEWTGSVLEEGDVALKDAVLSGTRIHEVDCRATLCRITFSHDDQASFDLFNKQGPDVGPWTGGDQFGGAVDLPGGGLGTYIYFVRSGDQSPFKTMRRLILERVEQDG